MTRIEAEQLALTKGMNDRNNNYVAWPLRDEHDQIVSWDVKAFPVHRGIVKGSD